MQREVDEAHMHGILGVGKGWPLPVMVTEFDVHARTTFTGIKAHEYNDPPEVLEAKVALLASLIRQSQAMIAYTGAGISTAAGIDDYASKAKKQSVTAAGRPVVKDWKNALPTRTHFALTALHKAGYLKHWLQNHDSLPQKAGYPQYALNEIHGSLHDPANPIVPYEGSLRDDLFDWMKEWEQRSDLCLALGTSMSGFNCDSVPEAIGNRRVTAPQKQGLGLVIVNLQKTPYDDVCTLRIFAKTDDVFQMLMHNMGIPIGREVYKLPSDISQSIEGDVFTVPFDEEGNPCPHSEKHRFIEWDLRVGAKVRLTDGPYAGDIGEIIEKNSRGDYKILFENSVHPVFNIRRRSFALWMGSWWVEMAIRGRGIVPGGKIPLVNVAANSEPKAMPAKETDTSRYTGMRRAGIPDGAIRHKMTADGFEAAEIDAFFLSVGQEPCKT